MINSIKRYLTNLYSKLKDADYGKILEYLLPENWLDYKKSYILFWGIALFSIIFVIWAAFAEINQVVRAQGEVIPDSKVHVIQSKLGRDPLRDQWVRFGYGNRMQQADYKKGAKNILDDYYTKSGLINWAKTINPEHGCMTETYETLKQTWQEQNIFMEHSKGVDAAI